MSTTQKNDDTKKLNRLPKSSFSISLKPSILKPPQLNIGSNTVNNEDSKKTFKLNPPKLNPFSTKVDDLKTEEAVENKVKENSNGESVKTVTLTSSNEVDSSSEQSSVKIVPVTANVTLTTSSVSSTSFIFGQNLKERVISAETENDDPKPSTSLNTNGATDMLFTDALKTDAKSNKTNNGKENKSLVETAREYEESRAVKRKYDEVEVKTGEEDETNILCMSCKLFSFDGISGTWQERGRGTLRLNDFEADNRTQSRLVFRTSGSLRVILNTKVSIYKWSFNI